MALVAEQVREPGAVAEPLCRAHPQESRNVSQAGPSGPAVSSGGSLGSAERKGRQLPAAIDEVAYDGNEGDHRRHRRTYQKRNHTHSPSFALEGLAEERQHATGIEDAEPERD